MESFSLVFWLNKLKNIFSNNFINSPIQKACMEKVPGCCEHMPVVWSELKSKRAEKVILLPFDLILLMPMDLYHTNCCFLPLGDMVFQDTGSLCLLSIMRACGMSTGLIQLLLVATILKRYFDRFHSSHFIIIISKKCYHRTCFCGYRRWNL